MTDAAVATAESGPLAGVIDAKLAFDLSDADLPSGFEDLAGDAVFDAFTDTAKARFYLDPAERRALLGPTDEGPFALIHHTDTLVAIKRDGAGTVARPWLALGLADLDDGSGSLDTAALQEGGVAPSVLGVLDPRFLLDLASGPLAGSIEEVGVEDVETPAGTVTATRFDANFDIPRVLDDTREDAYTDDRRETTETILDLLNITREVNPGSVWLDDSGLVRRFEITLRIEPNTVIKADITLSVAIDPASEADPDFALPSRRSVVRVDSLLSVVGAARAAVGVTTIEIPSGIDALSDNLGADADA